MSDSENTAALDAIASAVDTSAPLESTEDALARLSTDHAEELRQAASLYAKASAAFGGVVLRVRNAFAAAGQEKAFLPWAMQVTGYARSTLYVAMQAARVETDTALEVAEGVNLTRDHLSILDKLPAGKRQASVNRAVKDSGGATPSVDKLREVVTQDYAKTPEGKKAAAAKKANAETRQAKAIDAIAGKVRDDYWKVLDSGDTCKTADYILTIGGDFDAKVQEYVNPALQGLTAEYVANRKKALDAAKRQARKNSKTS